MSNDLSCGITELAKLICFQVSAWHDFGYEKPPAPECKPIPPLGKRSAKAIESAHAAVKAIDQLARQLHALRQQLISEVRQDEDIRAERIDQLIAGYRQRAGG